MKCAVNRGPVRSVALATTQAAPAVEPQTLDATRRRFAEWVRKDCGVSSRQRFTWVLRIRAKQCLLLVQSGHPGPAVTCPLSGVKRTWAVAVQMSAYDPSRPMRAVFVKRSRFRKLTKN